MISLRSTANKLFIFLVRKKQYKILILLVLLNIKEKNKKGVKRFFSSASNKLTILALDCNKYRGDLEVLSSHPGIRVLFMRQNPAGWLIKSFYSELDIVRYINAEEGSDDSANHKKAYEFMREFLLRFYKYISIDCVTTVNYRYPEDYNWAKVSDDIGVPFVMLYRECLVASDRIYDRVTLRKKKQFIKFHGSHIIVHNDKCKQSFIDSGYVSTSQVSVAGALRMDHFMESIKQYKNNNHNTNKRKFILFYFPNNINLFGGEESTDLTLTDKYSYHNKIWSKRDRLFIDLHNTIIELALEYPDIEFIIKPKKIMIKHKSWEFYKEVISKSKVNVENLPNYRVDGNLDVNKAIVSSSVICALQSSVVLESAIANKRVIFPLFYNFTNTQYLNDFFWRNDIELFDVATDKNHFKKIFKDALDNPIIPTDIQHKRVELFKKWFGYVDGNSLNRYYNIFKRITS